MAWNPTDHECPNCGGRMYDNERNELLACEDCLWGYTKASVVEWENDGPEPEPISKSMGQ